MSIFYFKFYVITRKSPLHGEVLVLLEWLLMNTSIKEGKTDLEIEIVLLMTINLLGGCSQTWFTARKFGWVRKD